MRKLASIRFGGVLASFFETLPHVIMFVCSLMDSSGIGHYMSLNSSDAPLLANKLNLKQKKTYFINVTSFLLILMTIVPSSQAASHNYYLAGCIDGELLIAFLFRVEISGNHKKKCIVHHVNFLIQCNSRETRSIAFFSNRPLFLQIHNCAH